MAAWELEHFPGRKIRSPAKEKDEDAARAATKIPNFKPTKFHARETRFASLSLPREPFSEIRSRGRLSE